MLRAPWNETTANRATSDAWDRQFGRAVLPIEALDAWLKHVREAGIPLFTVDTITEHAINVTTSDNYRIGSDMALRMAEDMLGEVARWAALTTESLLCQSLTPSV